MKIGILGTGAMGSLLAAYLAPHADVTVLGTWHTAVETINARGICIERDGVAQIIRVHATDDPHTVAQVDLALVAVKAHQTERAAQWANAILKPDGIALTLQNGLGNYEILAAHVGAERAAVGVTMQGATLLGPAHVRHAGRGMTTLAATAATHAALQRVTRLFNRAGIETQLANDIASLIWGKLVVNSAINALTAIYRVPNGWLVEHPETRALMSAAAQETANVANALGITLPYTDPVERALQVAKATASNKSSTLQDVLRGAPTELERINGAVVREGKRLGIPTPVNEKLLRVIANPRFEQHRVAPITA
ncbi:MAG: 2-dehydropantoate 2-reductase [Chloroflexi bacterium]|nr:2-dehydropantoate 2-reductase [Chloroflexota bacterium]